MPTRTKRKLLAEHVLRDLTAYLEAGGKLNTYLKSKRLPIHRPTVNVLLAGYMANTEVTRASLFPDWLDETNSMPQSQPDGYAYSGRFPYGKWVEVSAHDYF